MTMIISTAIFLIVIIGFAIYMKKNKAKGTASKQSASPSLAPKTETSPDQEYKAILDSLLKLNILLRKDIDLSKEMTGEIEAVMKSKKSAGTIFTRQSRNTLTCHWTAGKISLPCFKKP